MVRRRAVTFSSGRPEGMYQYLTGRVMPAANGLAAVSLMGMAFRRQ